MTSSLLPRLFLINSTSIFGGEAVARVATALMALVVARFYGTEALGDYGYALALASVLLIVPDFGLHLFSVRELSSSRYPVPEVFWGVHWLKLGLSGTVAAFAFSFGEWGIERRERRVLFYILVLRALFQTFSQSSMAVFKAFERMQFVALQQLVNSTIVVGWVAVSLALNAPLPVVAAGLVAGQIAETLLGWVLLPRILPVRCAMTWDRRALARIAVASFPFGVTAILLALNLRIDVLVLSHYASSRILGQFNAAGWFVIGMFLSASLFMSVLFPKLSRMLAEQSPLGSEYVLSLVKNALMAAGLGSLLIWLFAPGLIPLLFGSDFSPAAHILRILSPALPLVFLNTVFFYIFAAARRRFVCLGTLGLGLGAGTLLSVYLTSHYGATGTATADVVREFAMSAVYLGFLIQGNHSRHAGLALLKVFLGATALLALTVLLASPFQIQVMWLVAWLLFVLMGALAALGLPTIAEWRLLTDDRV